MTIDNTIWQQALDAQSACNLSALAHFLVRVLSALRADGINDTDTLNTHPIVRLVVAQMAHLAYGSFDCGSGNLWQQAHRSAEMEAAKQAVPHSTSPRTTP